MQRRYFITLLGGAATGSGTTGSGTSGSGTTGSGNTGSTTAPNGAGNLSKYSQCLQAAGSNVTKMQQCAPLLNGK